MVRRRQLDDRRIEDEIEELNTELKNLRMDRRERNSGVPRNQKELADEEEKTLSKKINALKAKLSSRNKTKKMYELNKIAQEKKEINDDYYPDRDLFTEFKEKQERKYKIKYEELKKEKEELELMKTKLQKRKENLAKKEKNYMLFAKELRDQITINTELNKQLKELISSHRAKK